MTEFDNTFRNCNFQAEVIFVNDGSTDKTELKMVDAMRRYHYVRLVKNRVRMGLTTALNAGFAAARGDILVFYPADLQFHPRDIPRMVDAIENGADMVCGKKVGAYGKKMVSLVLQSADPNALPETQSHRHELSQGVHARSLR